MSNRKESFKQLVGSFVVSLGIATLIVVTLIGFITPAHSAPEDGTRTLRWKGDNEMHRSVTFTSDDCENPELVATMVAYLGDAVKQRPGIRVPTEFFASVTTYDGEIIDSCYFISPYNFRPFVVHPGNRWLYIPMPIFTIPEDKYQSI